VHEKAFEAQCETVKCHCTVQREARKRGLTLFALALGSFCIGTSEFASMGIIQLFASSFDLSISQATNAITAYAIGVVTGAPLVTLMASRLNRRKLLLCLMGLFAGGNLLSAVAVNPAMFAVVRFISGLPQGAYFGAGAVVASYIVGEGRSGKAFAVVMSGLTIATIFGSPLATFLGQHLGWRATYGAVAVLAMLALAALWAWIPRNSALDGGPLMQELRALRNARVWVTMIVAALGVSSIFAVYTFIGPFVTDVAALKPALIPVALALFGIGMTIGNLVGGRLADLHASSGLLLGFGSALLVLIVLASFGAHEWTLMTTLFGVGATMMMAIPTIQVRLTRFGPEAPTLMGAMNLASLNVGNALGAAAGGIAVSMSGDFLSAAWAGFGLTLIGIVVFVVTLPKAQAVSA
jgi:MFS transporter, DHA1 family, inner membrane transport protein